MSLFAFDPSWMFFAIFARFLWAGTNVLDQYVARLAGPSSIFGNMIAVNIFMLPVPIMLAVLIKHPYAVEAHSFVWIGCGTLCAMGGVLPYLLALKTDDVQNVVPLMEFTPVFVTLLAYILFGDLLTGRQLAGAAMVIVGGFLFMWDFRQSRLHLRTLLLMAAASLGFSFYQLALRQVSISVSPWQIMLCTSTAMFLWSFGLFVFMPSARRSFIISVKRGRSKFVGFAFTQNVVDCCATGCIILAFAKAPGAGYVAALSGTQSFFILVFSLGLGLLWPEAYTKLVWDKATKLKSVFLVIIAAGIFLLKS